jgi:hypothetical protein
MSATFFAFLLLLGSLLNPMDKAGGMWDPNGLTVQTDDEAGNQWDPNGARVQTDDEAGSQWDPNG